MGMFHRLHKQRVLKVLIHGPFPARQGGVISELLRGMMSQIRISHIHGQKKLMNEVCEGKR